MALRILVVDDDPNLLNAIVKLLRSSDHTVEGCGSAAAALAHLAEATYDVLLTDNVMPERSGLELIGDARRASPGIRAIVMSGYLRPDGVGPEVTWLSKPIDIEVLLSTLEE